MSTPEELTVRREKSLRYMFSRVPFNVALGMELVSHDESSAVVKLPPSELIDNGSNTAHGGAIATLIDTAASAAAWAGHDYDKGTRGATLSCAVEYLAGTRGGATFAHATVLRRAKEVNFVRVDVRDEQERVVASGSVIYRIGT